MNGKIWLLAGVMAGLIFLTMTLVGEGNARGEVTPKPPVTIVIVQRGESLWTIASRYRSGDLRPYIYQIKKLNSLTSATIYPGQQLQIPAAGN